MNNWNVLLFHETLTISIQFWWSFVLSKYEKINVTSSIFTFSISVSPNNETESQRMITYKMMTFYILQEIYIEAPPTTIEPTLNEIFLIPYSLSNERFFTWWKIKEKYLHSTNVHMSHVPKRILVYLLSDVLIKRINESALLKVT